MLLNGLVFSVLAVLGMGCGDIDRESPVDVSANDGFVDVHLEAVVRDALTRPTGELSEEELLSLTQLDASGREVTDLTGIEQLPNLQVLDISDNQIRDLAALSAMVQLCTLDVSGNQVVSVASLSGLSQLQHLVLRDNAVRDIVTLLELPALRYVDVSGNPLDENSPDVVLETLRERGIAVVPGAEEEGPGVSGQGSAVVALQDFKIAYVLPSPDAGTGQGVYMMRVSGMESGDPVNLLGPATYSWLVWSPDGTRIAFVRTRDAELWNSGEIYVMDADGSPPVRLTEEPGYYFDLKWSPDGMVIAFVLQRGGNEDIYVVNADSGNMMRLTQDDEYDRSPVWSPDGTRIAFASYREGNEDIYVTDAAGGNPVNVTSSPVNVFGPVWSPDGTRIVCLTKIREGRFQLLMVNLDEILSGAVDGGVLSPLSFDEITGVFSVAPW